MIRILVCCLLASSPAFAQVRVEIRTEKAVYLEGEPIYFVASVTNVGEYRLEFGPVDRDLELVIDGVEPYAWRDRCGTSIRRTWIHSISETVTVTSHTPALPTLPTVSPGRTTIFRYLLRGYHLTAGTHQVRVSGTAPVAWPRDGHIVVIGEPGRVPHGPGDPVEGAVVDRTLPVVVKPGTEQALRAAFEPLLTAGKSISEGSARAGIYEMAPAFLTDVIAAMADDRDTRSYDAYQALADINTPAARAHLRRLHDTTSRQERSSPVWALARTAHAENLEFLASLVQGGRAQLDDSIRAALSGLACLGGDRAADAIGPATRNSDAEVRRTAVEALGRTSARNAVPLIIEAARLDPNLLPEACSTLRTLTHHEWCDGKTDLGTYLRQPIGWADWWNRNGSRVPIFSPTEEPPEGAALPRVP